jgi:hypothetical protein
MLEKWNELPVFPHLEEALNKFERAAELGTSPEEKAKALLYAAKTLILMESRYEAYTMLKKSIGANIRGANIEARLEIRNLIKHAEMEELKLRSPHTP